MEKLIKDLVQKINYNSEEIHSIWIGSSNGIYEIRYVGVYDTRDTRVMARYHTLQEAQYSLNMIRHKSCISDKGRII